MPGCSMTDSVDEEAILITPFPNSGDLLSTSPNRPSFSLRTG